jgi:hypothetical protein
MLNHVQSDRRQVEYLPGLHPRHHGQRQVATAATTAIRPMHHDLVGAVHLGKVGAGRVRPLPGPAATTTLPPRRRWLGQPVGGRRLGGVARMPAELAFQHCHPCGEGVDHPRLLGDGHAQLGDDRRLGGDGRFQIRGGIG